jgi:hypothetical protein
VRFSHRDGVTVVTSVGSEASDTSCVRGDDASICVVVGVLLGGGVHRISAASFLLEAAAQQGFDLLIEVTNLLVEPGQSRWSA